MYVAEVQNPLFKNCCQTLNTFQAMKSPSIRLVEEEGKRHHGIMKRKLTKKFVANSFGFEEYACRFAEAGDHTDSPASPPERLGFA